MKNSILLLLSTTLFTFLLVACSPAEQPSETFLDTQKQALDKAKTIEKTGLDYKKHIDNTVNDAG